MPDIFHTRIKEALADPDLQSALDANAENRLRARVQAYTSLPEDWSFMRDRAHNVRAQTIANLDQYLAQFITQAETNGVIVHNASDAAGAARRASGPPARGLHRISLRVGRSRSAAPLRGVAG